MNDPRFQRTSRMEWELADARTRARQVCILARNFALFIDVADLDESALVELYLLHQNLQEADGWVDAILRDVPN